MMTILLGIYGFSALFLALYTVGHGVLLWQYLWHSRQPNRPKPTLKSYPQVTIQLPIYNERYVAVRLLDAICQLDYPTDKLHIQVLDDSDDVTTRIIEQYIRQHPQFTIEHVRRPARVGYKAGALQYGLQTVTSEFVAIFDADFIPAPDFLQQTMAFFQSDDRIGVVQTRWGHLNPDANWLTKAQVLAIDNHFIIEQAGRAISNWVVPFNGTGGIWRVSAIQDAGGWSDDTLTEDLDLSYRAQLTGWKTCYLPEIVVPGELPPQLAAYRQQQSRWAKGGSQAFRKLIIKLWQSDKPFIVKLMATQPLVQYMPHLLMLLMLLISPILILTDTLQQIPLAPLGLIGLVPLLMYIVSQHKIGDNWGYRLLAFPFLLLIGTSLIWQNAVAVVSGLFQTKGEFLRTPKFVSEWQQSQYALKSQLAIIVQSILTIYSLWGSGVAWWGERALLPYFILHALAFGMATIWDIIDQWRISQQPSQPRLLPESGND